MIGKARSSSHGRRKGERRVKKEGKAGRAG